MSAAKFSANLFFLIVVLSHELMCECTPLVKGHAVNSTSAIKLQPGKKPSNSSARFFGKLSLLAGLGLPDAVIPSVYREDPSTLESTPPHFTASNNLPQVHWGPYVAAVYEPLPLLLRNPLSYLAAALNPFNWFVNSNVATSSTMAPLDISTQPVEDVVVLVNDVDNEIPEQISYYQTSTAEGKNVPMTESTLATTETTEKITDLVAEETTAGYVKEIQLSTIYVEEGRQNTRPPRRNMTTPDNENTDPATTITNVPTRTPNPAATVTSRTPAPTTMLPENLPGIITTIGIMNNRVNNTWSSINSTVATPHPQNNTSFLPLQSGYYYGGFPQNVSFLQLTTPSIANEPNIRLLQHPLNYNYIDSIDAQQQASFDYVYGHDYELPIETNDYQDKNDDFPYQNNNVDINGFKPSFPFYHK